MLLSGSSAPRKIVDEFILLQKLKSLLLFRSLSVPVMKWFTEFGHLNRGDMLTSEQHRCHNEKKKFQRRV
ncbi:hypothetical protein D2194_11390 [Escherichia coli]|nr:hypothetical protein D2194_11390 [Escherichia coli]